MNKQKQAQKFLDGCRIIGFSERKSGFLVDMHCSDVVIKQCTITQNGEYFEDEVKRFPFYAIMAIDPSETILNLKNAIQDSIGRRKFYIDEIFYGILQEDLSVYFSDILDLIGE